MKKQPFLLIISLFMFVSSLYAETGDTKFGIKAGLNLSTLNTADPDYTGSMLVGFHVGGIINISLSDNLFISPEILFTIKGDKEDQKQQDVSLGGVVTTTETNGTNKLSYLEIPISIKYKLKSGLYFNAGPYIGFLMGAKSEGSIKETTTGQNPIHSSYSSTDKTGLNATEFGLEGGMGYQFPFGLDLSVRYSYGLSSIGKETNYTYHNGVIGFSVGYIFGSK